VGGENGWEVAGRDACAPVVRLWACLAALGVHLGVWGSCFHAPAAHAAATMQRPTRHSPEGHSVHARPTDAAAHPALT